MLEQVTPPPTTYETGTYDFSGTNDVTGTLFTTNDVVIPPNPTPPPNSTSGCERGDFTPAPATPAVALIQRGTLGRSSGKARSVGVGPGRSYGQRSGTGRTASSPDDGSAPARPFG